LAAGLRPSIVSLTKTSSAQVGNLPETDIEAGANFRPEEALVFVECRVALVPNFTNAEKYQRRGEVRNRDTKRVGR
jgi:hypothetical protein